MKLRNLTKGREETKWAIPVCLLALLPLPSASQRLLPLDSCRALALQNNKELSISKVKQDIAANLRHSARTKYLPHVSALGTYMHTTEPISLLNSDQQNTLSNLGTGVVSSPVFQQDYQMVAGFLGKAAPVLGLLGLSQEQQQALAAKMQQAPEAIENSMNGLGQRIVDPGTQISVETELVGVAENFAEVSGVAGTVLKRARDAEGLYTVLDPAGDFLIRVNMSV